MGKLSALLLRAHTHGLAQADLEGLTGDELEALAKMLIDAVRGVSDLCRCTGGPRAGHPHTWAPLLCAQRPSAGEAKP